MKRGFSKILIAVILIQGGLFAQQPVFELGLWKQQTIKGSLMLEGLYRSQDNVLRSGINEHPRKKTFTGAFRLDSRSYLWHPNFLELNINLTYNPGIQNEQFLVIPNRTETRTSEQLRVNSQFFNQRPLSFNAFLNFNHNFTNREYAGRVEGFKKDFGGGLSFRNDYLPFSINYLNSDWRQKELGTGREFINFRRNVRTEFSKSFSKNDMHRLTYSYDDYSREYGTTSKTHNSANSLRLHNNITLNKNLPKTWNSLIFYRKQSGAQDFKHLQINENITFALPAKFKLSGILNHSTYQQAIFEMNQNNFITRIEHQLYLSLHSRAFYEYINLNHTSYKEYTHQGGIAFDYKKEIPGGTLALAYEHRRRNDDRNSNPAILNIVREEHILDDNQIALLDNPNINPQSVIVRDETGSDIYQENFDYILIQWDDFLEIQRLPTGRIRNSQKVFVDYSAERALSYQFSSNTNVFRFSFAILDRLIEPYFRLYTQDYDNVIKTDQKILKTALQRVYGIRVSKSFFNAGAEYDHYESNVMPYRSWRYFIHLTKNISNKINIFVRGNRRTYKLLSKNEKQNITDISGRVAYLLGAYSRASLDGGYRFQEGRGLDLNLSNLRAEFSTRFRAVYMTFGLEMYRRNFAGEKIDYNGGYVKVERKF